MHDSHAHIISDNLTQYPPANAEDPRIAVMLGDAFTAERLMAQMDDCGVAKALLVQRSQVYGFDNRYVIGAAAESGGRFKAVCNIDVRRDGCGDDVARLHSDGAAGFRLMTGLRDTSFDWLDGAASLPFWAKMADLGAPLCVHFFGWNRLEGLSRLDQLLDRYPLSHVVIDHLTNGPIESAADSGIDEWVHRMAGRTNVALKFTAIPLNGLAERDIDANAVLAAYLALFGPDRLLWGSDITQSKGSYPEMVASGRKAVAGFPEEVQAKLLAENVARIYGL